MSHAINPGLIPPPRGLEREEPEIAMEDDIPTDDAASPPAPAEAPKPVNPEPRHPQDPEKRSVESPPGTPEHPAD